MSTGTPIPVQQTCRQRCRYRSDLGLKHVCARLKSGLCTCPCARLCTYLHACACTHVYTRLSTHAYAHACKHVSGHISRRKVALYRHRRRHVHCAGMGVPVLKMTWTCHRRYRYRADIERHGASMSLDISACMSVNMPRHAL